MRFDDDCDAWEDYRAHREAERDERRDRVLKLVGDAHRHFPGSRELRKRWVRARMRLGDTKPKVRLGSGIEAAALRFPRTLREALFL